MRKIGVHVVIGPRHRYGQFLQRIASAGKTLAVVKCVDTFGPAQEAKGYIPSALTVGRLNTARDAAGRVIDLQGAEPLKPDGSYEDAREVATRYYDLVRSTWEANRRWIDVWETFNEFSAHWAWQSDFYLAMMDLAGADDFKLAHYACSTGNPPDVTSVMQMLPGLKAAKRRGHYLSLHEYGGVGTHINTLKGTEPYHALRYRHLYDAILIPNQADPPLIISECGPHAGYTFPGTQALIEDIAWYESELRKDPYVVGAAIFTLGNWAAANFQAALPALADFIVSTPPPLPPKPPLAEPYIYGKPPVLEPWPVLEPSRPAPASPWTRGTPRTQYTRIYLLLPNEPRTRDGNARLTRWIQALADSGLLAQYRLTLGCSADDAGVGDLERRHVFAINPDTWPGSLADFFAAHYPGVDYNPIRVTSPDELQAMIADRSIAFR